ncbi:MAG: acyltransferase family protein [Chitinophagales bacterium]|nr:acyltransferase family protein [Chitinophagales bacterium]MDW8418047.1 lysophospholipid acyltransferase family protein [Chitinophagales bacterium]
MSRELPALQKTDSFDFRPPSKAFARAFIAPFKFYFAPQFYGLDTLDVSKPAMYVSNHTVLGVLDGYPFAIELYLRKGIVLRALADSNHYRIPLWRELITERLGVVEASRRNCAALMQRKENLLVFPGGTREICRKKGEKYILKWSDRKGFVRMAMEYGYDIIPVAAIGAEEAFTIIKDADDFLQTPFGKFLTSIGVTKKYFKDGELIPPVVAGIGNTILPRPAKLYFSFGKRISTKPYRHDFQNEATQEIVKGMVERALKEEFEKLFAIRANDTNRSKWRRLLNMKKPASR